MGSGTCARFAEWPLVWNTVPPQDSYALDWTPSVRDCERALRAKRRTTRVVWTERIFGGIIALFGLSGLLAGDWAALPAFLFGIAGASGLWLWAYGRLFVWRRAGGLLPTRTVLTAAGVQRIDEMHRIESSWDMWKAYIPLGDMIILLSSPKGNAAMLLLPKRGLADSSKWPELADLVTAHVPPHPKLKSSRKPFEGE